MICLTSSGPGGLDPGVERHPFRGDVDLNAVDRRVLERVCAQLPTLGRSWTRIRSQPAPLIRNRDVNDLVSRSAVIGKSLSPVLRMATVLSTPERPSRAHGRWPILGVHLIVSGMLLSGPCQSSISASSGGPGAEDDLHLGLHSSSSDHVQREPPCTTRAESSRRPPAYTRITGGATRTAGTAGTMAGAAFHSAGLGVSSHSCMCE